MHCECSGGSPESSSMAYGRGRPPWAESRMGGQCCCAAHKGSSKADRREWLQATKKRLEERLAEVTEELGTL